MKRFGEPKTLRGTRRAPDHLLRRRPALLPDGGALAGNGRPRRPEPRPYHFVVNNITALKLAVETERASASCRTMLSTANRNLTQILRDVEMPSLDSYLVYAEEMRSVARVQAFRDFLVAKAQRWTF